jgi:DNA-binding MarR family transcriptional regulator
MAKTIYKEISQKVFRDPYEELAVSALYTGLFMKEAINQLLKPYGLNMVHYNVLRIVRGQGEDFVPLKIIKDVLLDKSINLSRSVDHLVQQESVERESRNSDRREIKIKITTKGRNLLQQIQPHIDDKLNRIGNGLSPEEAKMTAQNLDHLREAYRS